MSLSFVASAVQTATADGGFEETKIESKQIDAINQRNASKPLFEQLRQNQEEEQAKQEEMQREIMRGTRALDDEDVAHLDALEKQRLERERNIQQRTQHELLLFRAAKAERQQVTLGDEEENEESSDEANISSGADGVAAAVQPPTVATAIQQPVAPRIVVKKRKRKVESGKQDMDHSKIVDKKKQKEEPIRDEKESAEAKKSAPPATGIGGLLSGYGSSDSESDS